MVFFTDSLYEKFIDLRIIFVFKIQCRGKAVNKKSNDKVYNPQIHRQGARCVNLRVKVWNQKSPHIQQKAIDDP